MRLSSWFRSHDHGCYTACSVFLCACTHREIKSMGNTLYHKEKMWKKALVLLVAVSGQEKAYLRLPKHVSKTMSPSEFI